MKTTKKLNKELSSMIYSARLEAKLSQAQVARKIKTSQESISRAEKSGCGVRFAERILNACGFYLRFHHLSYGNENCQHTSFIG